MGDRQRFVSGGAVTPETSKDGQPIPAHPSFDYNPPPYPSPPRQSTRTSPLLLSPTVTFMPLIPTIFFHTVQLQPSHYSILLARIPRSSPFRRSTTILNFPAPTTSSTSFHCPTFSSQHRLQPTAYVTPPHATLPRRHPRQTLPLQLRRPLPHATLPHHRQYQY